MFSSRVLGFLRFCTIVLRGPSSDDGFSKSLYFLVVECDLGEGLERVSLLSAVNLDEGRRDAFTCFFTV